MNGAPRERLHRFGRCQKKTQKRAREIEKLLNEKDCFRWEQERNGDGKRKGTKRKT